MVKFSIRHSQGAAVRGGVSNFYSHRDWVRFREGGIRLDGGRCVRCGRSRPEVVLQLHHRIYVDGRKPWEYNYSDCETLCKGCHAQEHGILMPTSDWALLSSDDLGKLGGNCEWCDQELRYIYLVTHPTWGFMSVGTDCCDKLTESAEASAILTDTKNRNERRKTFMSSSCWKSHDSGAISIKQNGRAVCVVPFEGKFRITMADVVGKASYDTQFDAKLRVFEFFDNGKATEFFAKRREAKLQKRHGGSAMNQPPVRVGVRTGG
jgi:hypothetical protein